MLLPEKLPIRGPFKKWASIVPVRMDISFYAEQNEELLAFSPSPSSS
jgi:hypothetical protein